MLAAQRFAEHLKCFGFEKVQRVKVELFGSLAATGKGHGTSKAVLLGLEGNKPATVDVEHSRRRFLDIKEGGTLSLLSQYAIKFEYERDVIFNTNKQLDFHSNGMRFTAELCAEEPSSSEQSDAAPTFTKNYFSVGGGFIVDESEIGLYESDEPDSAIFPYPFDTASELLNVCKASGLSISEIVQANELSQQAYSELRTGVMALWRAMSDSIDNGIKATGVLPGGLNVRRRANSIFQKMQNENDKRNGEALAEIDWVSVYAIAINEENACGGRVVTAPTNGAAGIVPAVLKYALRFCVPNENEEEVCMRYLLTATAIASLFKKNASISGAEVGCQGEVGVACSMAAAGLADLLGATPEQIENAAEIAMEHNLGLTCDPIGGLVQVPCIERNAIGAVKAISAARLALRSDGEHFVSLDKVIHTMKETGRDMREKYKETALGGLAAHAIEVPVNIVEC